MKKYLVLMVITFYPMNAQINKLEIENILNKNVFEIENTIQNFETKNKRVYYSKLNYSYEDIPVEKVILFKNDSLITKIIVLLSPKMYQNIYNSLIEKYGKSSFFLEANTDFDVIMEMDSENNMGFGKIQIKENSQIKSSNNAEEYMLLKWNSIKNKTIILKKSSTPINSLDYVVLEFEVIK